MAKTERLACDRCGAVRQAKQGDTIDRLREQLRSVGWLCRDETDVCPPCRTKGL